MNRSGQQYDPWREDRDPPDTQQLDSKKLKEWFHKEKERKKEEGYLPEKSRT